MNATNAATATRIKALVLAVLDHGALETVSDEARIADDLGGDSLDAIELIMAIENEFDVEISDETAQCIHTVGDLVQTVLRLKG